MCRGSVQGACMDCPHMGDAAAGLCATSALTHFLYPLLVQVRAVEDEVVEGQELEVMCKGRDARGHVKVSRKALLEVPQAASPAPPGRQQPQQQQPQPQQAQQQSKLETPAVPPQQELPAAPQPSQRSPGAGVQHLLDTPSSCLP